MTEPQATRGRERTFEVAKMRSRKLMNEDSGDIVGSEFGLLCHGGSFTVETRIQLLRITPWACGFRDEKWQRYKEFKVGKEQLKEQMEVWSKANSQAYFKFGSCERTETLSSLHWK